MLTKVFDYRLGLVAFMCAASGFGVSQTHAAGLAEEFLQCEVPKGSVALVVNAPYFTWSKWTPPGKSLKVFADNYGFKTWEFGNLLALGPSMRTENSLPKGKPNPLHSLTSEKALTYLITTLNEAQWKALCSARGLGFGELNELQGDLLRRAIAPDGKLVIHESRNEQAPFEDFTTQLNSARIRIAKTVRPCFKYAQENGGAGGWISNVVPGKYYLASTGSNDSMTEPKAQSEVPNRLRAGELDLSLPSLETTIEVDRWMPVSDLVLRASAAAGLEIYADTRYGTLPALFVGGPAKVKAGDILRGLAVGLSATFRKVGPAYVLTDDVMGIGAKRQVWLEFDKASEDLLEELLSKGRPKAVETLANQKLTCFEDLLMPSAREVEAASLKSKGSAWIIVETEYGRLNASQQKDVKEVWELGSHHSTALAGPINDATPVGLTVTSGVEVMLPALDAPVRAALLDSLLIELSNRHILSAKFEAGPASSERLQNALKAFPSRAVALDLAGFPSDPTFLKTLSANGFDAVWIYVPTDVILSWSRGSKTSAYDLSVDAWDKAVAAVREAGLQVKALVDPMTRLKPIPENVDKDILGRQATVATSFKARQVDQVWMDPTSARVQSELDAVADWVAEQPLDGVAIRRSAAPGYVIPWPFWVDSDPPGLGYSTGARLKFLRKWSIDPVDVSWAQHDDRISVKAFDFMAFQQSQQYSGIWNGWRSDILDGSMRRFGLRIRARREQWEPNFLFMYDQAKAGWYVSSDLSGKLLPGMFAKGTSPTSVGGGIAFARTFGKRVDTPVTIGRNDGLAMVAARLEYAAKYDHGDGVVLFLTPIADVAEFVRKVFGAAGS